MPISRGTNFCDEFCLQEAPIRVPPPLGRRVVAQNLGLISPPQPQIISTSPDGKFVVRREKTDPGEHGEARKSLEVCSSAGKVLYA